MKKSKKIQEHLDLLETPEGYCQLVEIMMLNLESDEIEIERLVKEKKNNQVIDDEYLQNLIGKKSQN